MLFYKYLLLVPYVIRNILPIKTEKKIMITSYLGRWNQVATSRSTALLGTGVKFRNVTAEYDIFNNTLLSVYNSGIDDNNNFTSITGYSYTTGKSETKRKLHFDGVPVDGNYWIVKLGPIVDNTYRYAIISGALTKFIGTRFSLYVLARDREEYKSEYETEVKQWCLDNNFRFFWNKYIQTY
jgi:apolipoprotein D and lipocalin family protein